MSYAVHKETIKSSHINFVVTGNFVYGNKFKLSQVKEYITQQILIVRNTFFEVYEMFSMENQEDSIESLYRYNFLLDYHVFNQITAIEKFKLNPYQNIDAVVLVLDYAKIALVQYDPNNCDFKIICLYNLENENLSNGKIFYKDNLQIISSKTYSSLFILSNNVNITVLTSKYHSLIKKSEIVSEEEQLDYIDTILGEEYFEPSYYINFRDFSAYKIIKFSAKNKENENLDYNNVELLDTSEHISLAILYVDSGMGMTSPINEIESTQPNTTNFLKTKVNFGIFHISKTKKKIEFSEIFENLDQNSFDFIYYSHTRIVLILSPYSIQFVSLDQKVCRSIILNPIYVGVFVREFKMTNITNVVPDYKYANLSLDLRGGGFLSINDWQWIFTTSKGLLFAFSFSSNLNEYSINKIHLQSKNEYVNLDAPYKFIAMPHPGMFFFCSYFADAVFVIYQGSKYMICNKMINISPIINFSSNFDRLHTKLILTSGYDKKGYLNFLYEKLFFEIIFTTNEFEEISYLKALNFHDEIYSRYLMIVFKNGKNSVYEVGSKLENITDKVQISHASKILNCSVIKTEELNTNQTVTQFIVVVYQGLIQIFNSFFKLVMEVSLKQLVDVSEHEIEDRINIVKLSQNMLVFNTYYDKFGICRFNNLKNKADLLTNNFNLNFENSSSDNIKKIKLDENTDFEFCEVSTELNTNQKKILKFDINNKLIEGKNFLVVFREHGVLEIFDLNNLILKEFHPLFENNMINELPVIISDTRIEEFKNDFEKCTSDFTANIFLNNNHPQHTSFSTPEQIFFDILETKIVFSIIFKNGTIAFYEVFLIFREAKFFTLKMKKFFVDFVENIDYREFFYSEESNLFIKFENISDKAGVLLNIKGNQKMLFEVNGRLKFLDFENNIYIKRSISAFSEFSKEGSLNGFIYFENGILKLCNLPKNYEIKEVGLIKRNPLNRFPVNMNLLIIPQGMINLYFYILVEKELNPTAIKVSETASITVNKFIYFLTLRTEDPKVIDQIEFSSNEMIVESKIVELMDLLKKKTKYIAVGVNTMDEKGEEVQCKGKLLLYNVENGKFVKVLESELRGVISMIQSIEGVLIISEGSRIFLYQYVPLTNEIKKISVIDNKNLVVCSKIQTKFILTGDIYNSATWIVFKLDQDINSSSIYILGNDNNNYRSTAIDFWIDDSEENFKTGCLIADDQSNLHLFTINVDSTQSDRFKEVADIHLGKNITELRYYSYNNKSLVYYSADDGSIGFIKPISKVAHDRLSLLCEFLYNHLPFRGGLNPKMYFSTTNKSHNYKKEKGNILDMDILNFYLCLPISTQKIIAKNVVLSREVLIQNINEVLLK